MENTLVKIKKPQSGREYLALIGGEWLVGFLDPNGILEDSRFCYGRPEAVFTTENNKQWQDRYDQAPKKYIRLGNLPECGRSKNYVSNQLEAGVSCFEAALIDGAYYLYPIASALLLDPKKPWFFRQLFFVSDRAIYEIEGTLLQETGSDDEPLLTDVKIVKEVSRERIHVLPLESLYQVADRLNS